MKILLILVALVLVAALVGDVAAKRLAEDRIESQVADSIEGVNEVDAEIGAFPFLPSVLSGRLDELRLRLPRVRSRGLALSRLELTLVDLEFNPIKAFAGSGEIGVGSGEGRAFVSSAALTRALGRSGTDATVAIEGSSATISVQGQTQTVESIAVSDGRLVFELPTGPVSLQIPRSFEGVSYESARVENGRLRIDLSLTSKELEL